MKSTDKPVRLFRYGRAAAGLILLVNPIISLYDILPDFIGYLLLFTVANFGLLALLLLLVWVLG